MLGFSSLPGECVHSHMHEAVKRLRRNPQYPTQRQGFSKSFLSGAVQGSHPEPCTGSRAGADRSVPHGNSMACALPSPLPMLISPPASEHPPSLHLVSTSQQCPSIPGGPVPFPASAFSLSMLGLCNAAGMNLPSPPPAPRSGPSDALRH